MTLWLYLQGVKSGSLSLCERTVMCCLASHFNVPRDECLSTVSLDTELLTRLIFLTLQLLLCQVYVCFQCGQWAQVSADPALINMLGTWLWLIWAVRIWLLPWSKPHGVIVMPPQLCVHFSNLIILTVSGVPMLPD